jgi:two-component system, NarL family, invasion response regulator UvrY
MTRGAIRPRAGHCGRGKLKKVLVIDDHPIVLQGCRQVLEDAGAWRVVEAQTLSDGLKLHKDYEPDVIIVDLAIGAGELGGLSFVRQVRLQDKRTPILVFTMHSDPAVVRRTMSMGANGYVLKDGPFDELLTAIIEICKGRPYVSQELASDDGLEANPLDMLTRRELQTLTLLAEGMSYRKVARQLRVSSSTVATDCRNVKSKLGAYTLPDLMRLTIRYLPSAWLRPLNQPQEGW